MSETFLLFSPFNMGKLSLKNRIVALPVFTGYAFPDGRVSPMLTDHYARLAGSGAAVVVVANGAVSEDGVVSRHNLRVDHDDYIPGLADLARVIRQNGAIACLQLNHGGRFAKTDRPLHPSPIDSSHFSFNMASLKEFITLLPLEKRFGMIRYFFNKISTWRRIMRPGEQERVTADFKEAALRAFRAGFDMIELHGANGYLLCQYISAFSNKQASDFERRIQFPLTVIREVKRALPDEFPVGFRLLLKEWVPEGIDIEEALAFAKILENEGIAYFSASVGTYHSIFSDRASKIMNRPGYLKKEMTRLKAATKVPTIISGRIITPRLAETLLRENAADLIGLGRPLRADPEWVAKARRRERKITTCINCNGCLKRVILEKGFVCSRWPQMLQEKTGLEHNWLTRNDRCLWIITAKSDVKWLRRAYPLFMPDESCELLPYPPTLLFSKPDEKEGRLKTGFADYIEWCREIVHSSGDSEAAASPVIRMSRETLDKSWKELPEVQTHGMIFIARDPGQAWQTRLLYQLRGKVIALIGSNEYQHRVMVPVDLSPTTSLIMMFLNRHYLRKKNIKFRFAHVLNGPAGAAIQRWMTIQKIAGIDEQLPLTLLPEDGDVVSTLVETLHQETCGTVIMGKRGISGIKRWLLGSVSKGVLSRLTDQTLFLID